MQFNVSNYEIADTGILTVKNVAGDDDLIGADGKAPVTIVLYSSGSEQAVKALHKAGLQEAANFKAAIHGTLDKNTPEKAEQQRVAKLVAFTHSINNFPITPEALYSNHRLGYITRQVEAHISRDANFAKPSTPTSASSSDKAPG